MASKGSDRKTRKAVAKTTLQYEAPHKRRGTCRSNTEDGSPATLVKHLLRREWRVTLADHPVMVRGIWRSVMQQIASEFSDARAGIHRYRLVNLAQLPVASGPIEQTQLIIRIPATAANPAP